MTVGTLAHRPSKAAQCIVFGSQELSKCAVYFVSLHENMSCKISVYVGHTHTVI